MLHLHEKGKCILAARIVLCRFCVLLLLLLLAPFFPCFAVMLGSDDHAARFLGTVVPLSFVAA